jgi:hypothetical protein
MVACKVASSATLVDACAALERSLSEHGAGRIVLCVMEAQ